MDKNFIALLEYAENRTVINTHSHHLDDQFFENYSLDSLLLHSYVDWCGVKTGDSPESRCRYLEKVRFNSYFVWLQKSIQNIYNIEEPITEENWERISKAITQRHVENGSYHIELLEKQCHYKKVIRDAYWKTDKNNDRPELFAPAFRINMFLYGYNLQAADHGGENAMRIYNRDIRDIDEYIAFIREILKRKKSEGSIALKSSSAYDRGLDYEHVSKKSAQKALGCGGVDVAQKDIKAFQDYVFFELCKIAAELELPFQIHTGLGILDKTNAMGLQKVIKSNPDTKFVLFHGGYPWMDDICGLLHVYPNVYPDLCWLPLISTTAAERMLHELIEVGTSDKICWGCDAHTPEESFGALLAVRLVMAKVLADKIRDGYLNMEGAEALLDNMLYRNAAALYKL